AMDVSVQSVVGNQAEVRVAGAINQAQFSVTTEPLAQALGPQAYSQQVLLDLSASEMLDSSGVNWLLIIHRRTRESGGRLILHSLPPLVENVLKVLRMTLVFEIADDLAAARQLVAGVAS
ncbi:MAG TPA: STAS domain-containing protein, partial [Pirellulaceae bacterium]|nr:STAS domain-containing protein [Pirellulaceae bacterium]